MSRVGNKTINLPEGVSANVHTGVFIAAGTKGEERFVLPQGIKVLINGNEIKVNRENNSKLSRSLHGTVGRIIENILIGLSAGYSRKLEYKGVGFTVAVEGKKMNMRLGFSHPVVLEIPEDINITVTKNSINVEGNNKEKVGAFAAKIRDCKKPEVYKGKGIKYKEELIRKKAGKTASATK